MILHPGIGCSGAGHLIDEALLDAFVVLAWNRAYAPLEQTVSREGARIAARLKTADDAR
jgi:hypothetical protein